MRSRNPDRIVALDGLRGTWTLLVLLAHTGMRHIPGAFAVISMFFTFSGFMITKLLLDEHTRSGRIAIGRFWSQRARRLLPAALLTFAALTAHTVATNGAHARSILWSLFYGTNWELIDANNSYTGIFTSTNPVHHFWSLAIEEQFYVLWPVLLVGLLMLFRRATIAVAAGGAILLGGAVWSTAALGGTSAVYYHTATRGGELAIGVLTAAAYHRIHPFLITPGAVLRRVLPALQVVIYAAVVVIVASASLADGWVYHGGLLGFGVLATVAIQIAVADGPVNRLLRWRPLVATSERMYGLYVYHWPVYVLFPGGGLLAWVAKIGVVFVLAHLSYHYVEMPIRRGALATPVFAGLCVVMIAVCAPILATRQAVLDGGGVFGDGDPSGVRGQEYFGTEKPDGVIRVAIVGDSGAERVAFGLTGAADPRLQVLDLSSRGCPITGDLLRYTSLPGEDMTNSARVAERCRGARSEWATKLSAFQPDVVLLMFTNMNQVDLLVDGTWTNVTEPRGAAAITAATDAAVRSFTSAGYAVAISTSPLLELPAPYDYSTTTERRTAHNDLVARYVAAHQGVAVFPFAERMDREDPSPVDKRERPDGAHFTDAAAIDHARRWMLDTVIATAEDAIALRGAP